MESILSDSNKITKDWEKEKRIHMGNYGYLNIATNHPEIWKEIENIKHIINSFNVSRSNLRNFKDKIRNQMTIEELTKGTIKDEIKIASTKFEETLSTEKSPTAKRLTKKFTYSRSEFKEISIEAFKSDHIQSVLSKWEINDSMELTTEANNVLENLKIRHPKILEWDNYKIINRLSKHWDKRKSIQEKLTDDAINRVKAIDLEERQNDDIKKSL